MPELAEVEFYRRQWDPGLYQKVLSVEIHAEKRIFKGVNKDPLVEALAGSRLISSQSRGKQMLFRFSGDGWLGIHLGMTGQLRVAGRGTVAGKHDHLVLRQERHTLIFTDPRCFGRVRFDQGPEAPAWWQRLPADILSRRYTAKTMETFLRRHGALSLKGGLLLQSGFPGIGNWMADEILWRAGIHPTTLCRSIQHESSRRLWKCLRFVCREAMRRIGSGQDDLPKNWLFHQRWNAKGICPKHGLPLRRETIAGRTTAWCPGCQPGAS